MDQIQSFALIAHEWLLMNAPGYKEYADKRDEDIRSGRYTMEKTVEASTESGESIG